MIISNYILICYQIFFQQIIKIFLRLLQKNVVSSSELYETSIFKSPLNLNYLKQEISRIMSLKIKIK